MLKVLIVDNEAAIRKGLAGCMRWEDQGCTIVGQAADGIEALEQIDRLHPDIVISDIRMPGMDGLQLAETLHREERGIQVIILTGYPDFTYAQKAIGYGVVDFVLKPTQKESLIEALNLAKKRIEAQNQGAGMQRSLLLNDLIQGTPLQESYVQEQCRLLGLDLSVYQVLRVQAEQPGEDAGDDSTLGEESRSLFEEVLAGLPYTIIRRGGQRSYIVVESKDTAHVLALCQQVVHAAEARAAFFLTIGGSGVFSGPFDFPKAALQARQAQQFAAYSPGSVVVSYSEIPAASTRDIETITALLQPLRQAIEQGREEEALALLGQVFAAVRAARLPLAEVHKIGTFVVHFCVETLFLNDGQQSLADIPSTRPVLESETVDEMEQNLKAYLPQMLAARPKAPQGAGDPVPVVKAYVEKHYQEELTLEALARMVYLSPSYLSKSFKKETGENLSSYIQNVRMQKAKELLLGTSLKTYEVARQVGVPDPVYFARLFKKATGEKPRDFRARHDAYSGDHGAPLAE